MLLKERYPKNLTNEFKSFWKRDFLKSIYIHN